MFHQTNSRASGGPPYDLNLCFLVSAKNLVSNGIHYRKAESRMRRSVLKASLLPSHFQNRILNILNVKLVTDRALNFPIFLSDTKRIKNIYSLIYKTSLSY